MHISTPTRKVGQLPRKENGAPCTSFGERERDEERDRERETDRQMPNAKMPYALDSVSVGE